MHSITKRIPLATIGMSACALLAWILPGASQGLQYERDAISSGELWRWLGGHFTHWTPNHLFWDLVAFVLLATVVERHSRALLLATIAASSAAISAGVWFFEPAFETYRGLSGVDSALFGSVVALLTCEGVARRSWGAAMPALAAGAGFVAKTAYECASGGSLFVEADPAFISLPLAHLIGFLSGVLLVLAPAREAMILQPTRKNP